MSSSPPAAPEAQSGLEPWVRADLPEPPSPRGWEWVSAVGPGVIVLGASIGSGEFLLGPAVFVRHGLSLLWICGLAIFLQTVFNTEVMRYTLASGEPIITGFMRTRPAATFWAGLYALLYFLQFGWPAFAANAAGAVFFLWARRLADTGDAGAVYAAGIGSFVACVAVLLVGRRIVRTLEVLNWVLVTCIIGSFVVLAAIFVPGSTVAAALAGYVGFDLATGRFAPMPEGVDYFLLGALVAYSGAGGAANLVLSNWARDKGYGMGERAGYIPAAIGGQKVHLAHTGFVFAPTPENMRRWQGWWRIVRVDQWGVFFGGAMLGMALPALLYVAVIPRGTDIRGLGTGAALASALGAGGGPLVAGAVAFLGAWILLKTQLDVLEGMVRALTDIVWTGSRRVRQHPAVDVRYVYYGILATIVVWGIMALGLTQPMLMLQLSANVGGVVLAIASLHVLAINTRLLPPAIRPSIWRRLTLVGMSGFYATFVWLSVRSLF